MYNIMYITPPLLISVLMALQCYLYNRIQNSVVSDMYSYNLADE